MRPNYRNEYGMTLLELLAAITIGSIITLFVTLILIQSLNEQKKQTLNNEQHAEIRYVLKIVTKDMRKSTKLEGSKFISLNNVEVATYKFDNVNHLITRNDVIIASEVKDFKIEHVANGIFIKIETLNGNNINTKLYFRSGK